jgi:hypothetical protein
MFFKNKKGQSTLEYALFIAAIIGAFIVMQHYVQMAMHGKLKESADDLSTGFDPRKGGYVNATQTTGTGPATLSREFKNALGPTVSSISTSETSVTAVSDRWGSAASPAATF